MDSPLNKSPSDTTIYIPALQKIGTTSGFNNVLAYTNPLVNNRQVNQERTSSVDQTQLANQISDLIQGIQVQSKVRIPASKQGGGDRGGSRGFPEGQQPQPGVSGYNPHIQVARDKADRMIINAEHHRATINTPPGMLQGDRDINDPMLRREEIQLVDQDPVPAIPVQAGLINHPTNLVNECQPSIEQKVIEDDDFFHVSCHVDENLKTKIQRGEFVELEKLLPKNRKLNSENRMELVYREGRSYFVPAAVDTKISNIRRWEQAFRVYTAIYSEANPSRAAEIWQYIYVINSAASTYIWDNVANYDYTFRHLMSCNPSRSWAKIYNQMWNLSMKEFIPRGNFTSQISTPRRDSSETHSNQSSGKKQRKPKYCWAYNRGNCKEATSRCKFVHRCSYCDGDHANHNCTKKSK